MGNTATGSRDDDVLFYNPAQLVVARGMSTSAERLSPTASTVTLSSVTRLNTGGVAVGATIAQFEAPASVFPLTREEMLNRGSAAGSSANAVVGIAQVIKGFRLGTAVKYAEDRVEDRKFGRAALDVGVSRDLFRFYTAAVAVQNIGRSERQSGLVRPAAIDLPLLTTIGVTTGRPLGAYDVIATASVSMLRTAIVEPAAGAEVAYSWLDGYSIALRGGLRRPDYGNGRLTAGAGFNVDRVSIDYALETLSGSRLGQRIGLRVR